MEEAERRDVSPASSTLESLPVLFSGTDEEFFEHEYYFSELTHSLNLLQGLNRQRLDEVLCDVTISVGDYEFPCHRNVLAACSVYFLAMFTGEMRERQEARVPITGIDPTTMKHLIDYAYTSDIVINKDNAQYLLSAANMVQMQTVVDACCRFLEKEMDPSNCLGIHCFAEAHLCAKLSRKAMEYILETFEEVAQYDELLLLPQSKLIEIIQSDKLKVDNEETVLQVVIDWVKHDPDSRQPQFADVLKYVRLPLVNAYFLFDKMDTEPLLSGNPECRSLLDEALKYYILKDRHGEMNSIRAQPRLCRRLKRLLVTVGGEIYSKNYLNNVDCYSFGDGQWIRLKELPFPRCHHGSAVSNGSNIYVSGGFNKEKHVLDNVLRYEAMLDKWIKVASMKTPRARHAMATLDGYVYVLGGYDGQSRIASTERYCPRLNQWSTVAPMVEALSRCQATGLKGHIYVAGGTTEPNNQCVDLLQRYTPRSNTWETLSPMTVPRCLSGLVAARGLLYAVGGTEEMVHASKKLSCYNPSTDKWSDLAEMIEPRFEAGVAVLNSKIYIVSGHDGENSFYNTIEEYNLDANIWSLQPQSTLPYGRSHFGCVALTIPEKGT